MAKREEQKTRDIEAIRDWTLAVVDFMCDLEGESFLKAEMHRALENSFKRGNRRGLEMAMRDQIEFTRDLPEAEYNRLDGRLTARFGWGLSSESESIAQEVREVIERGRIVGESEYRLLHDHVEAIWDDPSLATERDRINQLLTSCAASDDSGTATP